MQLRQSLPPPPYPGQRTSDTGTHGDKAAIIAAAAAATTAALDTEPTSHDIYDSIWAPPPLGMSVLQELACAWDRANAKATRAPGAPTSLSLQRASTSRITGEAVGRDSHMFDSTSPSASPAKGVSPAGRRSSSGSLRMAPVRRLSSMPALGSLPRRDSTSQTQLLPLLSNHAGAATAAPAVLRTPTRNQPPPAATTTSKPAVSVTVSDDDDLPRPPPTNAPPLADARFHFSKQASFVLSDSDSDSPPRRPSMMSRMSASSVLGQRESSPGSAVRLGSRGSSVHATSPTRAGSARGRRTVTESQARHMMDQGYGTVV